MICTTLNTLWRLARACDAARLAEQATPMDFLRALKLPIAKRYQLNKTLLALETELTALEVARTELVNKLGEPTADGSGKWVPPDSSAMPAFVRELDDLLKTPVELPGEALSFADAADAVIDGDALRAVDFLFMECQS